MLVRVHEIAPPDGKFCHGGGNPQTFVEVDWFRDDEGMLKTDEGRKLISDFVKDKNYFDPKKAYLVLSQEHSFTINYSAP